jgi:16S rRNA (guanine527-N7)-methyltransferase
VTLDFRQRLLSRVTENRISLTDGELARVGVYFQLLRLWNRRINLSGFDLNDPSDRAIDKLICEPIAAARHFPSAVATWFDVGSGGGSPAIPIKIVRSEVPLTMVEMRGRKAAFLREVCRELDLWQADVRDLRFQDLACEPSFQHSASVITIRAVRGDASIVAAAARMLGRDGSVLVFGSAEPKDWAGFAIRTVGLWPAADLLSILTRL